MRNRERIPFVLDYMKSLWRTQPDLRFGQFLLNAFQQDSNLYYVEDEELMKMLARVYVKQGEER